MESCSDSDSNDDGLEIGRHGHGDEDIVINTEHASKEVDAEGDGEAEAVAGVDEGMNSRSGRSYSPSGSGFHHSASVRKDDKEYGVFVRLRGILFNVFLMRNKVNLIMINK